MPKPTLSKIVDEQIQKPSPIRQIMKMAERKNIINMGLDPDDVISFGGGWVNHKAPEEFRQSYIDVCSDPSEFHKSGAYSTTLGDSELRELVAKFEQELFGIKNLSSPMIFSSALQTLGIISFFWTPHTPIIRARWILPFPAQK
jgi:aspartate/methionine/tyrosine aminotransferase